MYEWRILILLLVNVSFLYSCDVQLGKLCWISVNIFKINITISINIFIFRFRCHSHVYVSVMWLIRLFQVYGNRWRLHLFQAYGNRWRLFPWYFRYVTGLVIRSFRYSFRRFFCLCSLIQNTFDFCDMQMLVLKSCEYQL